MLKLCKIFRTEGVSQQAMNKICAVISDPTFEYHLAPENVDQIKSIEKDCFSSDVSVVDVSLTRLI